LIRFERKLAVEAGLAKARYGQADGSGKSTLRHRIGRTFYEKAGRKGDAVALIEKASARPSSDSLNATLSGLYVRAGDPAKAGGGFDHLA
jgi:hypothetical protein